MAVKKSNSDDLMEYTDFEYPGQSNPCATLDLIPRNGAKSAVRIRPDTVGRDGERRCSPEQIITHLRDVEILVSPGKMEGEA
jgi:hypothetical protein